MARRAWFHGWWRSIPRECPEDEVEEFVEVAEEARGGSIFDVEGVIEAFTGVAV